MPELDVVDIPFRSIPKRNVISYSSSVGSCGEHVDAGELSSYIQVYCTLCSNNLDSRYNRDSRVSSVLSTITLQTAIMNAQHTHVTP